MSDQLPVEIGKDQKVSAIVYPAAKPKAAGVTLILGHGAGAGQTSGFMVSFATALAARGIETVTFNFSYMEQGRRLPDSKDKLEACYRAVIETVAHRKGAHGRLAIGGKSMGGRIASQVASASSAGIAGIVMLGYPLHPPGRPDKLRTAHLPAIRVPMLFVQGERDAFGTPAELEPFIRGLPADLQVIQGGDHSFKVAKSAGVPQEQVDALVLDSVAQWVRGLSALPHAAR
jgi:hypothetical protein